jgi:hypothetical protein
MEARIKKAYALAAEVEPSAWHLSAIRLIRSQLYACQPRIPCSFCGKCMDPLTDEWYTKNTHPSAGIYCAECLSEDPFTPQTLKSEALRRYILHQAVRLGRESAKSVDGPGYSLTLPPYGVDPKDYVPKKRPSPAPVTKEVREKVKARMLEIGPDTLPGLEVMERRQAYLESKGYTIDPAYIPSTTIVTDGDVIL